jgi:DNA-binding XRE family transcriptional regulator
LERILELRILYISNIHQYTNFRPNYRSKGGVTMDLKVVGQRIKEAREAKNLTQEELAALVDLSSTHVSVIERGLKVTKLDTFGNCQCTGCFSRYTSGGCYDTLCNWSNKRIGWQNIGTSDERAEKGF